MVGSNMLGGAGWWNANSFANDQYGQVIFGGSGLLSGWCGPTVRTANGARTFYCCRSWDVNENRFIKRVAGTHTQIGSAWTDTGCGFSGGCTAKIIAAGTTFTVSKNGADFSSTRTDSSIASGAVGYIGSGSWANEWWGGDGTGPAGASFLAAWAAGSNSIIQAERP
jgi:hypothetical protein